MIFETFTNIANFGVIFWNVKSAKMQMSKLRRFWRKHMEKKCYKLNSKVLWVANSTKSFCHVGCGKLGKLHSMHFFQQMTKSPEESWLTFYETTFTKTLWELARDKYSTFEKHLCLIKHVLLRQVCACVIVIRRRDKYFFVSWPETLILRQSDDKSISMPNTEICQILKSNIGYIRW